MSNEKTLGSVKRFIEHTVGKLKEVNPQVQGMFFIHREDTGFGAGVRLVSGSDFKMVSVTFDDGSEGDTPSSMADDFRAQGFADESADEPEEDMGKRVGALESMRRLAMSHVDAMNDVSAQANADVQALHQKAGLDPLAVALDSQLHNMCLRVEFSMLDNIYLSVVASSPIELLGKRQLRQMWAYAFACAPWDPSENWRLYAKHFGLKEYELDDALRELRGGQACKAHPEITNGPNRRRSTCPRTRY